MSDITLTLISNFFSKIIGSQATRVKLIGSGATSTAWQVDTSSGQYVLRVIYLTTNRPITYRSEFNILQSLYEQGLPVPEPITNSFQHDLSLHSTVSAWTITRQVRGKAILKNKMPTTVARELGLFLSQLHAMPCEKFGRLDEQNSDLVGQSTSPVDGICKRWCWADIYPFDETSLTQHYIAELSPDLMSKISKIENTLWDILDETPLVLNHSDLHGDHIFIHNNHLSGVIDYGTAFIATYGWDFAVLAYYHGWDVTIEAIVGYTGDRAHQQHLLHQSHYLALVVALYKLQKLKDMHVPEKTTPILRFIAKTMQYILTT